MNYNRMLSATLARRLAAALTVAGLAATASFALAAPADDTKEAARLYQQGKLDQALAKVNDVLAQQPKDAQARFVKGLIFTEQKKSADAIQIFTGLTEDYPELPEPYNNLAVLYASQGNYDKAKAALELAIHTHPSYATAYENLGDIYAQLARRSYDKVLQLDKNNTTAQSKLAMVKDLFTPAPKTAAASAPTSTPTTAAVAPVQVAKADAVKTAPDKTAATKPEAAKTGASMAKPEKTEAVRTVGNADAQIRATVAAWARAWAAKDVTGYLAFYAADFETPDGLSRAAWEEQRRARIDKPGNIEVEVKMTKITVTGNEATAVFRQAYRAGALKSNNTKTLKLVKNGDKWLIRSERAGG